MAEISLAFGDVFELGNQQYIFLVKAIDVLYAAAILSSVVSKKLDNFCNNKAIKSYSYTDNKLFCYTILTTEEVKERAAQYGEPGIENWRDAIHKLPITLNKVDMEELKAGILATKATPGELKDLVKKIKLE